MAVTSPKAVFELIHSASFTLTMLKAHNVSEHFTWAEVFTNRTLLEVKQAPIVVLQNAVEHSKLLEKVRAYLREKLGEKTVIVIKSWWRSLAANATWGGAKKSQHLLAFAADFYVPGYESIESNKKIQALLIAMKDKIGFCLEITNGDWTHVDGRPARIVFENIGGGQYSTWGIAQMSKFMKRYGVAA